MPEFCVLRPTQLLCPWALDDDKLWSPSHHKCHQEGIPASPDGSALVARPFLPAPGLSTLGAVRCRCWAGRGDTALLQLPRLLYEPLSTTYKQTTPESTAELFFF